MRSVHHFPLVPTQYFYRVNGRLLLGSRCRQNLKFGSFTLSFGRLRRQILLKCVPHMQHDFFPHLAKSLFCGVVFVIAGFLANGNGMVSL